MSAGVWFKVGELARRTGLTVRTLHFYEEIGLLKPGERTEGGHRLYGPAEVERLQRITSMRQLGFTLEEIGDLLDGREGRADVVLERHIAHLHAEISRAVALAARLTRLAHRLRASDGPEVEDLLLAIEETVVHDQYFTAAQIDALRAHRAQAPDLARTWQGWGELIAEARVEQERGTAPDDPRALELARRWTQTLGVLMPADPAIREAGSRLFEGAVAKLEERFGLTAPVLAWIGAATQRIGRVETFEVPGARLYCEVRGSGPILLLLPGGDGDVDGLRGVADLLVDRYTVVTYDRRGLSRSPQADPADRPTLEVHADDVHRLLAAVTSEPALVFGGSFGALVGLALVAAHPEQVRALVAHEAPVPSLLPEAERQAGEALQLELETAFREQGPMAAIGKLMQSLGGLGLEDREPDVPMPGPNPRRAANLAVLFESHAPAARRYQPDLPALVAAADRIVAAAGTADRAAWTHHAAEGLAEWLGQELVEFPGGHNGYAMQPRAFAAKLAEVLRDR